MYVWELWNYQKVKYIKDVKHIKHIERELKRVKTMKKHIPVEEDTHTRLYIFRVNNKFKSFDEAINKLLDAYKEGEKESNR